MSKSGIYISLSLSLFVLLLLFLLIFPKFLNIQFMKGKIQEALNKTTGLEWELKGPIRLSLIPTTKVNLEQIFVSDPSKGITIEISSLDLKLRFLPLLKKKILIDHVIANSFLLELDTSKLKESKNKGQSGLKQNVNQGDTIDSNTQSEFYLKSLRLHKGIIKVKSNDQYKIIKDLYADISSSHDKMELTIKINFEFNELKFKLDGTTSSLNQILSQKSSQINVKLQILDAMNLNIIGNITYLDNIFIPTINAEAQILELSKILTLSNSSPKNISLKNLHLKSDIHYKDKIYHMNGSIATKDDNLQFTIKLPIDTKDAINLNITSDMINLNDILKDLNGEKPSDKVHGTKAKEKPQTDSHTRVIHTTISINRLLVKDQEFRHVRLKGHIKGGIVKLEQGSLKAYGGDVDLKALYQMPQKHSHLWAQIGIRAIDASLITDKLFNQNPITGKVNGEMEFEAKMGQNLSPITNNKGHGKLVLSNGEIKKGKTFIEIMNFLLTLKGKETAQDSLSFKNLIAPFELKDGVLTIKNGTFDSQMLLANFKGTVDLKNELVDIYVEPVKSPLLGTKKVLPFKITGRFSDIKVIPEYKEVLEEKAKKYLDLDRLRQKLRGLNF